MTDRAEREAAANAREAIEWGIATIKENQAFLTEGQIKEIKRIIYHAPSI